MALQDLEEFQSLFRKPIRINSPFAQEPLSNLPIQMKEYKVTTPNCDPFLNPISKDSYLKCIPCSLESGINFRNTYFQHFVNSHYIHLVFNKKIQKKSRIVF